MKTTDDDRGCGCAKTRRRYKVLRALLVLAGLSLAFYMPWKALTQYESLREIYGPWFLQGAVVTAAGLFFALRPGFASRLPLVLRLAVAASAVLWMRTGLACTPNLISGIQASLGPGLFAFFHMFVQHVFLALGVIGFAMAPRFLADRMGQGGSAEADALSEQPAV